MICHILTNMGHYGSSDPGGYLEQPEQVTYPKELNLMVEGGYRIDAPGVFTSKRLTERQESWMLLNPFFQ